MADRVSLSIAIGGLLAAALVDDFVDLLRSEDLSTEWGGDPFERDQFPADGPLRLYAHGVRNGEIPDVEDFCCANDLPFARWSGGAPGAFGPEIVVWTGDGPRRSFRADEDEHVVLGEEEARELGSFEAISGYFADGRYEPPTFQITN